MKCPKYIKTALLKRASYASKFTMMDVIISEWVDKHQIQVEEYDIYGGCESIVNPYSSIRRILEAIEEKE